MKPVRNIVILGGGTSGWMCAAVLARCLPRHHRITLVESAAIGIVGVGEATLPQIRELLGLLGVPEAEFMRETQATIKLGIEFVDWGVPGSRYVHPFGAFGAPLAGADFHHAWVRARQAGPTDAFETFSYAVQACRHDRFEPPAEDGSVRSSYAYAYHVDATLMAPYLRTYAEARGVRRIEAEVTTATTDPVSGDIVDLNLASGETVAGDLFVDCSGFRSVLLGQALQVPWEDWSKWLPCDRAWAVPSARADGLNPYTRCTARDAGWQWRIPLQTRTGNGYVYASAFVDDQVAVDTLMGHLDTEALGEARQLRFRAGRRSESWRRNCVAIGLAGGFLEPLESTSLYLAQRAVTTLAEMLPDGQPSAFAAREFNRRVDAEYDRIRDFLILHYHLNAREGTPFWDYVRTMAVPASLSERMDLFRSRGFVAEYSHGLFAPPSWLAVFIGQGLVPQGYDRLLDAVPAAGLAAELSRMKTMIADAVAQMPDHGAWIARHCPTTVAAPQRRAS